MRSARGVGCAAKRGRVEALVRAAVTSNERARRTSAGGRSVEHARLEHCAYEREVDADAVATDGLPARARESAESVSIGQVTVRSDDESDALWFGLGSKRGEQRLCGDRAAEIASAASFVAEVDGELRVFDRPVPDRRSSVDERQVNLVRESRAQDATVDSSYAVANPGPLRGASDNRTRRDRIVLIEKSRRAAPTVLRDVERMRAYDSHSDELVFVETVDARHLHDERCLTRAKRRLDESTGAPAIEVVWTKCVERVHEARKIVVDAPHTTSASTTSTRASPFTRHEGTRAVVFAVERRSVVAGFARSLVEFVVESPVEIEARDGCRWVSWQLVDRHLAHCESERPPRSPRGRRGVALGPHWGRKFTARLRRSDDVEHQASVHCARRLTAHTRAESHCDNRPAIRDRSHGLSVEQSPGRRMLRRATIADHNVRSRDERFVAHSRNAAIGVL